MATNRTAGVAHLKVDGKQYQLRGNLIVSIDSIDRQGIAGQDGVHGFKETPRVPFISGEFSDSAGLSLTEIEAITDVTVLVELGNGKSYVLRNAWTAEARELNASEGSLSIKFEGMKGEEVK